MDVRVAVIGGGFSGIGAAIKLREAGIDDFTVLEKGSELGGTWRDNTYPGCACDVPSAVYSFSFAPNPGWSHVYARQAEIQAYLRDVADRYGVRERVRLGTEVHEAEWDEGAARWRLNTGNGPLTAQAIVSGAGPLHEPVIPGLPGLESFKGKVFHSSRWDHDHDLTGERVAVVGTGASAAQFVPEIQPKLRELVVFQRTAPWILPRLDRRIGEREKELYRRLPITQKAVRNTLYGAFELVQLAQRKPEVMQRIQKVGLSHLKRQVSDPELLEALTPNFTLGCKRILLSNTWYPAVTADNATLVPHAVREVREHSLIGADGVEREVDTIIFGTGFHATDPPIAERVHGRSGASMAGVWRGSPAAYLGTTVAGFPNLFLLIGPNIGNGHSSAIVLVEAQLKYTVDALKTMERDGLASVEVRENVQRDYNERVQKALQGTVWNSGGCSSYYLDANGNNAAIYPWTTIDLRRRLAHFDRDSYATEPVREPVAA